VHGVRDFRGQCSSIALISSIFSSANT
jgi:hypothetical protein